MKTIAYRQWQPGIFLYISNLPGDGGVDWGYHPSPARALALSPYWQRRFRRFCLDIGALFRFIEIGAA
jgi:hypothetical protein